MGGTGHLQPVGPTACWDHCTPSPSSLPLSRHPSSFSPFFLLPPHHPPPSLIPPLSPHPPSPSPHPPSSLPILPPPSLYHPSTFSSSSLLPLSIILLPPPSLHHPSPSPSSVLPLLILPPPSPHPPSSLHSYPSRPSENRDPDLPSPSESDRPAPPTPSPRPMPQPLSPEPCPPGQFLPGSSSTGEQMLRPSEGSPPLGGSLQSPQILLPGPVTPEPQHQGAQPWDPAFAVQCQADARRLQGRSLGPVSAAGCCPLPAWTRMVVPPCCLQLNPASGPPVTPSLAPGTVLGGSGGTHEREWSGREEGGTGLVSEEPGEGRPGAGGADPRATSPCRRGRSRWGQHRPSTTPQPYSHGEECVKCSYKSR